MTLQELNQHFELREKLSKAEETLSSLRAACLGAQVLTGMPHSPGISDKVGDLAVEIADMSARIDYLNQEISASEATILEFISGIDNDQTRTVFRLRFIRCLTWGEVARVVGGRNTEDSVRMICYRYLNA